MQELDDLMSFLNKNFGKEKPKFLINNIDVTKEEDIISSWSSTLSTKGVRFQIAVNGGYNIAGFNILQFPTCCGKFIVHDLYLQLNYKSSERNSVATIDKVVAYEMWKDLLDLSRVVGKRYGQWSSLMLVVSKTEQPNIKSVMDLFTKVKPTWQYEHHRYNPPHEIFEYSIDFATTTIE